MWKNGSYLSHGNLDEPDTKSSSPWWRMNYVTTVLNTVKRKSWLKINWDREGEGAKGRREGRRPLLSARLVGDKKAWTHSRSAEENPTNSETNRSRDLNSKDKALPSSSPPLIIYLFNTASPPSSAYPTILKWQPVCKSRLSLSHQSSKLHLARESISPSS